MKYFTTSWFLDLNFRLEIQNYLVSTRKELVLLFLLHQKCTKLKHLIKVRLLPRDLVKYSHNEVLQKKTFRIIFLLSFSNLFLICTSQLNEQITRIKFHNSSSIYVEIFSFRKKNCTTFTWSWFQKKDLFSCKRDFLSEQWDISDQCGGKVREMIGSRGRGGFNGKGTDPRWSQTLQSGLQGGDEMMILP